MISSTFLDLIFALELIADQILHSILLTEEGKAKKRVRTAQSNTGDTGTEDLKRSGRISGRRRKTDHMTGVKTTH